jgi:uroporphyrinogen decarboxylase
MTSRELILAAINGSPHPRVPVAQHNFAFCVRQAGITMDAYRRDPELAARVLVAAAEEFGYDCIIIDFDTSSLAEAMGARLDFPEDDMARVSQPSLDSIADIRKLPLPDPHKDGRLPLWLETTRAVRRMVGDRLAIMARADQGPFGLLFQLRGHENFMMDLLDEEEEAAILDALEYCAEAGARFARAQMDAGADLTSIGDSACGQSLISPAHYMKFGRPYQAKYRERMGDGILSLHICGKTNDIIEGMATTGCEVLEDYEYTHHHPWQPGSNEFARADPDIVGPPATRACAGRFRRAPVLRHRRHRLCEATASPRAARAARPGL